MSRDTLGHETRFSDSAFYDEVCIHCGATDAPGANRLAQVCAKSRVPTVRVTLVERRVITLDVPVDEVDTVRTLLWAKTAGGPTTTPTRVKNGARVVEQAYTLEEVTFG